MRLGKSRIEILGMERSEYFVCLAIFGGWYEDCGCRCDVEGDEVEVGIVGLV